MPKKGIITIHTTVLFLAILFAPIPKGSCNDGGTGAYAALTYKIVVWHRLTDDGVYKATKIYWFPGNFKSLDDLWAYEK